MSALAACGGGGGSTGTPPAPQPPAPAPVQVDASRAALVSGLTCSGPAQTGWCRAEVFDTASGEARLLGLWMESSTRGQFIASDGRLFDTQDGGRRWQMRALGLSAVKSLSLQPDGGGWLSDGSLLMRSADGGRSWQRAGAAPAGGLERIEIGSGARLRITASNSPCPIAGRCGQRILLSEDAGLSWAAAGAVQPYGRLAFASPDVAWRTEELFGGVQIQRSSDAGRSWQSLGNLPLAAGSAWRLRTFNAQNAWILGEKSQLLRTRDGGAHWEVVALPGGSEHRLQDIDFADAQQGWLVGEGGLVLATRDGGASWERQASGTQEALRYVKALDAKTVWMAGERQGVWVSATGGRT